MKVQVSLKSADKASATSKIEVHVNENDTVGSVKEKVAASQLIASPGTIYNLPGCLGGGGWWGPHC